MKGKHRVSIPRERVIHVGGSLFRVLGGILADPLIKTEREMLDSSPSKRKSVSGCTKAQNRLVTGKSDGRNTPYSDAYGPDGWSAR